MNHNDPISALSPNFPNPIPKQLIILAVLKKWQTPASIYLQSPPLVLTIDHCKITGAVVGVWANFQLSVPVVFN
jgi:hypothetical protein